MRIFFLIVSLAVISITQDAHAQAEVCKVIEHPGIKAEDAVEYCDMHQRRFAYREERNEFKSDLDERRNNYHAPFQEIQNNYKAELEALNNSR